MFVEIEITVTATDPLHRAARCGDPIVSPLQVETRANVAVLVDVAMEPGAVAELLAGKARQIGQ